MIIYYSLDLGPLSYPLIHCPFEILIEIAHGGILHWEFPMGQALMGKFPMSGECPMGDSRLRKSPLLQASLYRATKDSIGKYSINQLMNIARLDFRPMDATEL